MPTYTDRTGRRWNACSCLVKWLPVFEQELLDLGVIKHNIDVAQLIGGASASAGTHSKGGAFDIWQRDDTTIKVAREMGAATWHRTRAQGFQPHAHGVLNGCPHNGPARYQIAALAAGYNGLGYAGRGGRDDGPSPRSLRSWEAGIEWAKKRQAARKPSTPPAPKPPARPKTEPRRWFRLRGDNLGGFNDHGAKTWDDRLPAIIADIDATKPDVQALLEVPNGKRAQVSKALASIGMDMVTDKMTNGRHLAIADHVTRYGHGKLTLTGGIDGDPKHGAWVACSPDGKDSNAVLIVTAQLQHAQTAAGASARLNEFRSLFAQVDALRVPTDGAIAGRWKIPWTRVVLYVDTNDYDGVLADAAARLGFFDAHEVAFRALNPELKTYRPFDTKPVKGPTSDMVLVYRTRPVAQSGTRVLNPQVLDHLTRWADLGYSG